jgi:hypothetical protein
VGGCGGQGGDAGGLKAEEKGMVIGDSGDLKGNTGARLKERRKINAIKAGGRFTMTKPGELNHCEKNNTKGINITKKVGSVK